MEDIGRNLRSLSSHTGRWFFPTKGTFVPLRMIGR
jgi:hypothetical protein